MLTTLEKKEEVYQLFMQAPVGIYLLKGEDYVIEMANEPILQLWGKGKGVIGKPVLASFPEVKEQGFIELLDQVRTTGKPFQTDEIAVWYNYNGEKVQKYVTLLYQPFYEGGSITGIFSIATDVTEKVLAKKQLEESEKNLRNLILHAPVAMCILKGPSYVVEIANSRMVELWGKQENEVLGKPIFEGVPEAKNQGFEDLLRQVYAEGQTIRASERPVMLPRRGGLEKIYVNFVYEPLREQAGVITGVMAVAVEITDQVVARKKIEESAQEVRSLVASAPFPIGVYTGKEMRIKLANQSIIDVWGKGPDVIGKLYTEILPELTGTGIYEQLEQVYTTGIPFHARNQQVDLMVDGKIQPFYFNYSFTPLFNMDGKVYGVMNTAAEITDLHIAKQQVEQSERNFRSMILQAPVAMCIMLGPEHVVDIANKAMIELWGKPEETVMHKPIFEALPDARNQGLEKLIQEVYQTGNPFYAYEHPVDLLRNGKWETVYQNFVYQPYKDVDGQTLGVLAISVDVSMQVLARQKIEEVVVQRTRELADANMALLQSNAELTRLNTNLEEFAYAASHDLKEPIRKIHFFADVLKEELEGQLNEQQEKYFDRLEKASTRMKLLVDDLLAYSQTTKGAGDQETVDLNRKVQLVLEDLELEIQQKNAKIDVDPLPTITANKRQFQQLFQNLIGNALKYSQPGVAPEIRINYTLINGKDLNTAPSGIDTSRNYHHIRIADNGIGFPQEEAHRIFNVFTRLHNNAERGSGVGLSIAQKVVQNHSGFIWAEGKPGEGATFQFILPAD